MIDDVLRDLFAGPHHTRPAAREEGQRIACPDGQVADRICAPAFGTEAQGERPGARDADGNRIVPVDDGQARRELEQELEALDRACGREVDLDRHLVALDQAIAVDTDRGP